MNLFCYVYVTSTYNFLRWLSDIYARTNIVNSKGDMVLMNVMCGMS